MDKKSILVIEDDRDIAELIKYNLDREGYLIDIAAKGTDGLRMAGSGEFELILLDLMLPDIGGLEICRKLRRDSRTAQIPVIMVTAKGEEADVVAGLESGADDYIVKPFSPRVLLARINAVIRRKSGQPIDKDRVVSISDLEIHPGKRQVLLKGHSLDLTFTEFELLHYLASRPGWVFTRYQLVNAVKGEDYPVTDRSVDVQIAGLRRKLGAFGSLIETIRGVGYRFSDKASSDED